MNLHKQILMLAVIFTIALGPTVGAAPFIEDASRWGSIDRLLVSLATVGEAVWDTGGTLIGSAAAELGAQDSTAVESAPDTSSAAEEEAVDSQTLGDEPADEMGGEADPFG